MSRYIVFTYDSAEQTPYVDFVDAQEEIEALALVATIRPNIVPVLAYTVDGLHELAIEARSTVDIDPYLHQVALDNEVGGEYEEWIRVHQ